MNWTLGVAAASVGALVLGLLVGVPANLVVSRLPFRGREAPEARSGRRLWLVMGLTGVVFLLAFLRFGISWQLLIGWWFAAVMIVVAFIDLEHMIIPNIVVLPSTAVGLAASIALEPGDWWVYVAASAGAAFFLFVLALAWPGGMGPGDVKLALLMGAVLGRSVIAAMFLAFLAGAAAGLILLATKRRSRKDKIPFGPYLALGSVVALLAGDLALNAYLGMVD